MVDITDDASPAQIKQAIGSAAAHYMQTSIRPNDMVGISSWSSTIRAMVDNLHPLNIKTSGVIQLLGGVGPNGNVQATLLTQSLANILNCPAYLLPAQSIERSTEDRARLISSGEVADVVNKFAEVDLALVGIGVLEPSQLLKIPATITTKRC